MQIFGENFSFWLFFSKKRNFISWMYDEKKKRFEYIRTFNGQNLSFDLELDKNFSLVAKKTKAIKKEKFQVVIFSSFNK